MVHVSLSFRMCGTKLPAEKNPSLQLFPASKKFEQLSLLPFIFHAHITFV